MPRFTRSVLVLAAVAALAVPVAAQAATKQVYVGVPPTSQKQLNEQLNADVNDYFPHTVTIRAGDKVRFLPSGFHTVDFPPRGGRVTALAAPTGQKADAKDAAGNPFWFSGQDVLGLTPALAQGGFGKSYSYTGAKRVQSGLPLAAKPKPMTVRFPKKGSYTYLCAVHPGMKGVVRVKARSARVPSAKADRRAVANQLAAAVKVAKRLGDAEVPAGTVHVGESGGKGVEYFGFLPKEVTVPTGTTLTFRMSPGSYEVHTATTGPGNPMSEPNSYIGKLAASFQGVVFDPAATYPSDQPGAPASLTPQSHGNGFWNSGVLDNNTASPFPASNAVKFAAAGTYTFYCLIHPFMTGTVKVT